MYTYVPAMCEFAQVCCGAHNPTPLAPEVHINQSMTRINAYTETQDVYEFIVIHQDELIVIHQDKTHINSYTEDRRPHKQRLKTHIIN